VIECFEPERVRVLRREEDGVLVAKELRIGETLKEKTYRRHSRRWLAEAMLSRGVIVGEGVTERDMLLAAAAKLESVDPDGFYPLDLSGVSIISVDGEGSLAEFGEFFADLDIRAYAFFDAKAIKADTRARIDAAYSVVCQTPYIGAEKLLADECPVARLWEFLEEVRDSGTKPGLIPNTMPNADKIKATAISILKADKGAGYAGRLIELCADNELPETVVSFMAQVYGDFPKPDSVPPFTTAPEPAPA
jgi:putative ATP-dependent endonuclease of OLD family